jgi:hypothetical protein
MANWHRKLRGVWYTAMELAVGMTSIAIVMVIAKYGL